MKTFLSTLFAASLLPALFGCASRVGGSGEFRYFGRQFRICRYSVVEEEALVGEPFLTKAPSDVPSAAGLLEVVWLATQPNTTGGLPRKLPEKLQQQSRQQQQLQRSEEHTSELQ